MILAFATVIICLTSGKFIDGVTSQKENVVQVQFDQVNSDDWNDDIKLEFQNVIANVTGSFCQSNLTACEMTQFYSFEANDVQISPSSPLFVDVNAIVNFAVRIPGSNPTVFISKSHLFDIVKENRVAIQAHLLAVSSETYEASFRITFVDDRLVAPPGDQSLNRIMTPIVVVVVFVLVLVVLGLEMKTWYNRRMKISQITKLKEQENMVKREPSVTVGMNA